MKIRLLVAATALGAASLLGASSATALPLNGCTLEITGFQTCNLYESDPNGSPSEISSVNSGANDWHVGYLEIFDPNPVLAPVLSDIVIFAPGSATLYSFDDGGLPPPGYPGTGDNVLLGSVSEDLNGFATFQERFGPNDGACCDTINIFSPPDAVPEPVTVSIFGAGLVGAAAVRRRRKRNAA